jgi:hypothetical protein
MGMQCALAPAAADWQPATVDAVIVIRTVQSNLPEPGNVTSSNRLPRHVLVGWAVRFVPAGSSFAAAVMARLTPATHCAPVRPVNEVLKEVVG